MRQNGVAFVQLACGIAATFLANGCAVTPSNDIQTAAIYAQFNAQGNSTNQVVASAQLQVGGPTGTYIELSSGDTLTCNGVELVEQVDPVFNTVSYQAGITYQAGGTYTFVLTRAAEGSSYSATVALPDPLVITAPMDNATVTMGQALPVTWTEGSAPEEEPVSVSLMAANGSTLFNETLVPDTGGVMIPATDTLGAQADSTGTLTITRNSTGTFPSALQGGATTASQTASVAVDFIP